MAVPEESTRIVQLKVRLLGISPMIWRRVLVPASVTLRELHGILQVSMGWEGIHLYHFDIHAVHYGSFELSTESPDIALSRFRFRKGSRFAYLYDLGDYGSAKKCGAIRQRAAQLQPICPRPSVLGTTARTSPAACRQGFASGPAA